MSGIVEFQVLGTAQPAGSKRAFANRKTGRAMVVDANPRAKPWKAEVSAIAYEAMAGRPLLDGPLMLEVMFVVQRPKGHFGKRGLLPSAPWAPAKKPDVLKLTRGLEDALSGVVYKDDAQIVEENLRKRYGEPERTIVRITALDRDPIAVATPSPHLPEGAQQ